MRIKFTICSDIPLKFKPLLRRKNVELNIESILIFNIFFPSSKNLTIILRITIPLYKTL